VTASFIIIAQLVIRRHVLSVLRKSADLDEGDAIRLYTFISPWLAMLLIGWNAANLAAFGVLAMVHEAHVAGMLWRMIWLLIVYAAWSGWRRRLYDGITFFADRGPDLGKRLSRSLAVGAVTGAVICYFIMEIAYVGIISSTCSPDSLKWPHLQ
jgi:hypothetical protein